MLSLWSVSKLVSFVPFLLRRLINFNGEDAIIWGPGVI